MNNVRTLRASLESLLDLAKSASQQMCSDRKEGGPSLLEQELDIAIAETERELNPPNNVDSQYLDLLEDIMDNGVDKGDRTGTGTKSVFGRQLQFDLSEGFPLLTTKKVHFKSVAHELLWMINGSTNVKYLQDNGVSIWNAWARPDGELGPVYGSLWRKWLAEKDPDRDCDDITIDQLADVIKQIKENPDSRRHIVTAWNPGVVEEQALPPCHLLYQFYVVDGKLSCSMYQRSCDVFLGLPFNIAGYALLTHLVANATGLKVGSLTISLGDAHIYNNHFKQVEEQLSREPKHHLPELVFHQKRDNIDEVVFSDFYIDFYDCHPSIKAKVSV